MNTFSATAYSTAQPKVQLKNIFFVLNFAKATVSSDQETKSQCPVQLPVIVAQRQWSTWLNVMEAVALLKQKMSFSQDTSSYFYKQWHFCEHD